MPTAPTVSTHDSYTDGTWTSEVEVEGIDSLTRIYRFTTDQPQRDNAPQQLTVTELEGQPVLRSGRLMLDGLFALAVQEARDNSVSEVNDGAFASGAPLACECFRTGELWPWVWTRDTAFAADLGLAWLDPRRVADSLRFKLSAGKPGAGLDGTYVLQDTGTGGSWPVSSDRVVWATGALAVLQTLAGSEREAFLAEAFEAMAGTAEQDRIYVYDAQDGLYRGETSFLDWREQSYPPWMADDAARIAETKALSTNVLHLVLLEGLVQLADELGDSASAERYGEWAQQLRQSVPSAFRTESGWASFVGGPLDPGPHPARDLLGTALAARVLEDSDTAGLSVATWPMGQHGPPVIWPNHAEPPVYHNRAVWPFASAYLLRAARHAGNDHVVGEVAQSLLRASALNLTQLENLDWATGLPDSPAVNSRAQLWSVGAFLSLVADGLFGLQIEGGELVFSPLLPVALRDEWLGDEVTLHHFPLRGERIDLVLELPPAGSATRALVSVEEQREEGRITVTLGEGPEPRVVAPRAEVALAPRAPQILGVSAGVVSFSGDPGVQFELWRDGDLVASEISGSTFTDPEPAGQSAPCYAAVAVDTGTGLRSHRSAPVCDWGSGRVQVLDAHWLTGSGSFATDHGRPHIASFGAPQDKLEALFRPGYTGAYLLQPSFANGNGPVNTGITAGHLWMTVREVGGDVVASGSVVLPHTGAWDAWRDGTSLQAQLSRDQSYQLTLEMAPNGSLLAGYSLYGGAGGGPAPVGWVDIAEIKLLARSGPGAPAPGDHVLLDGTDDLGAFAPETQQPPGVPLADWDAFALDFDADYLYLAIVSPAFEGDYTPFLLYLQADPGPEIAPASGLTYSGLAPALPFTPTHAIALRAVPDAGDGLGPYAGVWVPEGGGWRQIGRLQQGVSMHTAADRHTLSARVPRAWLADPSRLRLVGHVVNAQPGEEWKDTIPAEHTPWDGGGSYLEVDL